jgi:hypothetical protein|tara:strand:+ start:570 stop:752 length:183 start_codon:yes stop_codon:yes gene_type:complete
MKKDLIKLKELLTHQDNNIQHLQAINIYIQLFYNKWKNESTTHVEEITNHHIDLLEKLNN